MEQVFQAVSLLSLHRHPVGVCVSYCRWDCVCMCVGVCVVVCVREHHVSVEHWGEGVSWCMYVFIRLLSPLPSLTCFLHQWHLCHPILPVNEEKVSLNTTNNRYNNYDREETNIHIS